MKLKPDSRFSEIALIAAGACCLIPGAIMGWEGIWLAQDSARTTGEHLSSRASSSSAPSGQFGQNRTTVTATVDIVGFETADGEWVKFETAVPKKYKYGEVPVRYVPDSPKTACIEPCQTTKLGGAVFVGGMLMLTVGAVMRRRRKKDEEDDDASR